MLHLTPNLTQCGKRAPELDLEFHGGDRFHGVVLATGIDDDDLDPRLVLDTHIRGIGPCKTPATVKDGHISITTPQYIILL